MKTILYCAFVFLFVFGCKKQSESITPPTNTDSMHFPSTTGTWESVTPTSLGWNTNNIQSLNDFLIQKNTKSFMILVNGRIVMEEYFNGHTASASWEWNSAGKTLTAATIGIAQQEGLLTINDLVSKYLNTGWTSAPLAKEDLIKVSHLLSMSSGLNDSNQLVIKSNLTYMANAGTRWAYANVFQKLMDIIAAASGQTFDNYFNAKLKNKIGMEGYWNYGLIFKIYHSNTRSMARFGLLALNKGKWNTELIVNENYFNECITSSQTMNPSYGYLWWLNGKSKFMIPGSQVVIPGYMTPNAPADMYAAMGANDQRIYIIPSKKMVIIRMGEASDPNNPNFAVSGFDTQLWDKLNAVVK